MADMSGFGRRSVVARVGRGGELETRVAEGAAPGDRAFVPAAEKYEVEASIGRGGMGEVMLVSDRDLKRQVAMKVLKEDMAKSAAHRMRFVAEAQATSQLEHPGILPVHDIGITPSGRVYFTMKLVRGRTLGEVLRDLVLGVRPVRREYNLHKLVSILERIAEALHFAHERGVIHRDLKPENIMLGDFGEVHVMDWGIAKVAAESDDEFAEEYGDEESVQTAGTDVLATQAGTIKGTIPYMSPEQARGEPDLDRRSDVYALGCLLYEVLTLHAAFEGDGMALLARVRRGDFPPVTERNPRRTVPEALGDLCTRAMAGSPGERPETARVFGDELRSWLDGRAERARKHVEAEALAAQGKEAAKRFVALRDEINDAERAAEALQGSFESWQPHAEKVALHEARERVTDLRREVAVAFGDATALLNAALAAEESNATALRALSDLWVDRLASASARSGRPPPLTSSRRE